MIRRASRLPAALAGMLAACCLALAVSAPSASAAPFCHGQSISNYQYCRGPFQTINGVQGWGAQRAICIGVSILSGGCAPVGVLKQMTVQTPFYGDPWLQVNAAGTTVVYGSTW